MSRGKTLAAAAFAVLAVLAACMPLLLSRSEKTTRQSTPHTAAPPQNVLRGPIVRSALAHTAESNPVLPRPPATEELLVALPVTDDMMPLQRDVEISVERAAAPDSVAMLPPDSSLGKSRRRLSDFDGEVRAASLDFRENLRRYSRSFLEQGPMQIGASPQPSGQFIEDLTFAKASLLRARSVGNRVETTADLRGDFASTRALAALVVTPNRANAGHFIELRTGALTSSGMNLEVVAAETTANQFASQGAHVSGLMGWNRGGWSLGGIIDQYSGYFRPAEHTLTPDLQETVGSRAFVNYQRNPSSGPLREFQGSLSWEERDTSDGTLQRRRFFATGNIELTEQPIRFGATYFAGPYRPVGPAAGTWSSALNDDRYLSLLADFGTRGSWFGSGFGYSSGFLGGGAYSYVGGYWWAQPTASTSLTLTTGALDNFGKSQRTVLAAGWSLTPRHTIAGSFIHAYSGEGQRLSYSWRATTNADVMLALDRSDMLPADATATLQFTIRRQ